MSEECGENLSIDIYQYLFQASYCYTKQIIKYIELVTPLTI